MISRGSTRGMPLPGAEVPPLMSTKRVGRLERSAGEKVGAATAWLMALMFS